MDRPTLCCSGEISREIATRTTPTFQAQTSTGRALHIRFDAATRAHSRALSPSPAWPARLARKTHAISAQGPPYLWKVVVRLSFPADEPLSLLVLRGGRRAQQQCDGGDRQQERSGRRHGWMARDRATSAARGKPSEVTGHCHFVDFTSLPVPQHCVPGVRAANQNSDTHVSANEQFNHHTLKRVLGTFL